LGKYLVECRLCGFSYSQITGKHLKASHGISTVSEYSTMFPDASIYPESVLESMGSWQTGAVDRNKSISLALTDRNITWGEEISEAKVGIASTRSSEDYSKSAIDLWNSPGYKERMIEVHKNLWANPEHRYRQIELMHSGSGSLHPNYPETCFNELLDFISPGTWKFNKGELVISGKIPDYYRTDGIKSVIELFGDYWHKGEPKGYKQHIYREAGYSCLILWVSELKLSRKSSISKEEFLALLKRLWDFSYENHGAPLE
jgi:hypothetical protein